MTVKSMLMPTDYFNLSNTYSVVNDYMFSLIGVITIVAIIYEMLNDGNIFMPIKRAFLSFVFCAILLPCLNFTSNASFNIADGILENLGDSDNLSLINNPVEFYDTIVNKRISSDSETSTEAETIDGVEFQVTELRTKKDLSTMDVIGSQLKDIPNVTFSYIAVGWIWLCFIGLEISFYLLYFFTGAMFAIPTILSIFPTFSTSVSGAFKSIGVLFITPIVTAVILALLSLKVGSLSETGTLAESMKNVVVVMALCTALGSSIMLSSGFLEATGLGASLGKVGAMATSVATGTALGNIGKLISNRDNIIRSGREGLQRVGNFVRSPANFAKNGMSMAMSGMGSILKSKANSRGFTGKATSKINEAGKSLSSIKDSVGSKITSGKDSLGEKLRPNTTIGRAISTAKAMVNSPEEFKRKQEVLNGVKTMGIKSALKPKGHEPSTLNNLKKNQEIRELIASKPRQPKGWGVWNDDKKSRPSISIADRNKIRDINTKIREKTQPSKFTSLPKPSRNIKSNNSSKYLYNKNYNSKFANAPHKSTKKQQAKTSSIHS